MRDDWQALCDEAGAEDGVLKGGKLPFALKVIYSGVDIAYRVASVDLIRNRILQYQGPRSYRPEDFTPFLQVKTRRNPFWHTPLPGEMRVPFAIDGRAAREWVSFDPSKLELIAIRHKSITAA